MNNTNKNFQMGRSTCALVAYLLFTIGVMTLESCSTIPLQDPNRAAKYITAVQFGYDAGECIKPKSSIWH